MNVIANKLTLFFMFIVLSLAGGQAIAFSYDVDYPDQMSMFKEVTANNTNLTLEHRNQTVGYVGGIPMPSYLQIYNVGTSVRMKIMIPPGVNYAGFGLTLNDDVAYMGVCEFSAATCPTKANVRPSIWPVNYFPGSSGLPTATTDVPQYVQLVIESKGYPFASAVMTLQMYIGDYAKYEAWRKNAPVSAFSLSPSTKAVSPGDSFTLSAVGGTTLASCSSSGATVVLNPVTAGATQVSGSLAQGATTGATVSCTSSGNQSATAQITVAGSGTPQPGTSSGSAVTVARGASTNMSEPSGKTLSNCQSFTPAMVSVSSSGATLTANVARDAAIGTKVSLRCETPTGDFWYNTIVVAKEPSVTAFVYDESKLTITATADGDATGYWVALPNTTTSTPSIDLIKTNAAPRGSGEMKKGVATVFDLRRAQPALSPNTSYQVYFYAEISASFGSSEIKEAFIHTPRNKESITGTASGAIGKLTLSANITPSTDDSGLGKVYVAATVPPQGYTFFMTKDNCAPEPIPCWKQWSGNGEYPQYSKDTALTHSGMNIDIIRDLDATNLNGTTVYAAYQKDNGYSSNSIYTIKPRPTLQNVALVSNSVTTAAAKVTATASSNVTAYWVAIPYTTTPPTQPSDSQIRQGQLAAGAGVVSNYNNPPAASQSLSVDLTGLTPATRYKLFLYGDEATGNNTLVQGVDIRTKGPTVADISGNDAGSDAKNLKLTVTIVPAEADVEKSGDYFVYAVLPTTTTAKPSDYFYLTERGCSPVGKCWVNLSDTNSAPIPYAATDEPLLNKTLNVNVPVDAKLAGAKVMASYRQGQDTATVLSNAKQVYLLP